MKLALLSLLDSTNSNTEFANACKCVFNAFSKILLL
jgi:hypothetical protein